MSFAPTIIHSGKIFTLDDIAIVKKGLVWRWHSLHFQVPKQRNHHANDDRRDLLDIFREPKRTRLDDSKMLGSQEYKSREKPSTAIKNSCAWGRNY